MADQLPGLLLVVALVVLAWAGMAWGWRRRSRRHSDLPVPHSPPDSLDDPLLVVEGLFVGTVLAEQWLDRVVAQGLGSRSGAALSVFDSGVLLDRDGRDPIWIRAGDLLGSRRDTGLAGKVTETGGLVVWTWRLGDRLLESGLRPRFAADVDELVRALDTARRCPE
jgi:hypothetical protein